MPSMYILSTNLSNFILTQYMIEALPVTYQAFYVRFDSLILNSRIVYAAPTQVKFKQQGIQANIKRLELYTKFKVYKT